VKYFKSKMAQAATLLISIQEVIGLSLCRNTGYPNRDFSRFPLVSPVDEVELGQVFSEYFGFP
jgi:hypothetical protein